MKKPPQENREEIIEAKAVAFVEALFDGEGTILVEPVDPAKGLLGGFRIRLQAAE